MMTTTNNNTSYYASPTMMNDSGSTYTHYDDTCMTDMSMTSAWSSGSYIPTPFSSNNNTKFTKTATSSSSRRKSSGNLLSRSKSVLFNPSTWSSSKQADHLDDESTYCHLSDDGTEVLAGETHTEKSGGKRLKRSGSLSNMLKTPSRLTLRKSSSKLKLFGSNTPATGVGPDTLASAASIASYANRELPPLPPLPATKAVPAASSATPSSAKSTKSLFARAVLRDRSNRLPTLINGDPDHAFPGTVANQVQRFQNAHGSQPAAPSASVGKTPKQNWLGRLHIGRSSGKKKVRLEIPSFEAVDSPSFQQSVDAELTSRNEQGKVLLCEESVQKNEADSICPL